MSAVKPDCILIDGLELAARIGVPDEERAQPQRLTVTLLLEPQRAFRTLNDEIENAVNYHRVALAVQQLASSGERHLLETLAEEIAQMLLREFPLATVEIELRKYILPDTNFVAVEIRRGREGTASPAVGWAE